jgi:hypothetical protein
MYLNPNKFQILSKNISMPMPKYQKKKNQNRFILLDTGKRERRENRTVEGVG